MLSVVSQWALNFGCWVQPGMLLNKICKTHIILLSRAVSTKVNQAAWYALTTGLMEFPLVLTTLSLQRLLATIGVWMGMFITLCSVNFILNSLPPLVMAHYNSSKEWLLVEGSCCFDHFQPVQLNWADSSFVRWVEMQDIPIHSIVLHLANWKESHRNVRIMQVEQEKTHEISICMGFNCVPFYA